VIIGHDLIVFHCYGFLVNISKWGAVEPNMYLLLYLSSMVGYDIMEIILLSKGKINTSKFVLALLVSHPSGFNCPFRIAFSLD
jgi:hypothetical protein